MQQNFESPVAARTAAMAFMANPEFGQYPAEIREKYLELLSEPSPVVNIVHLAEFLYARQGELGDAGRDLAGSLASYAGENYWHEMHVEGRGNRIALSMRRENGEQAPESGSFPDAGDDPAPLPRFLGAQPEPAVQG